MLGEMMADYLELEMHQILDNWNDIYKIKEEDFVYCHYFQPEELEGRCKIIGPRLSIAKAWDNKIFQYQNLKQEVPLPHFTVYEDFVSMVRGIRDRDKVFITLPYGDTGHKSIIYDRSQTPSVIAEKLGILVDSQQQIRVSEFIDKDFCISIHSVISAWDDIYMSQPVKQIIGDDGVTFRGGEYPIANQMTGKQLSRMFKYTRKISQILAYDGYRGMVGIDYMIKGDDVIFCEINPRKMGTTVPLSMTMDFENDLTIPALEYDAVIKGKLPEVVDYRLSNKGWYLTMDKVPREYPNKPGDEKKVFLKEGTVKYVDEYFFEFSSYGLEEI